MSYIRLINVEGTGLMNEEKSIKIPTEHELLSMSEDDYMNEEQLAFFKMRLLFMKEELLNKANQTSENLRETPSLLPDLADRAAVEEEYALELHTRDRERKLLRKIEEALYRIQEGSYGWCDETGEAIGIPRLLARPTTSLSIEAQQRRELRQKLHGD